MYGHAHQMFAIGVSTIVIFLFGIICDIGFALLFITIIFAGIAGVLPDWDINLRLEHRGVSHRFGFAFVASIIMSTFVFFIAGYLQIVLQTDDLTRLPLLAISPYFPIPNITDIQSVQLIGIFLALFIAIRSHNVLDRTTPSGINEGNTHYEGNIYSNDAGANGMFIAIGWFLTLIGLVANLLVHYLEIVSGTWFYIVVLVCIVGLILLLTSLISKNAIDRIYCGKVNGIELCIVNTPCIQINGKKICFENPDDPHFI